MPEQTISCDANDLINASKCYCFDAAISNQIMIYLLNVISGLNLTPEQLAENSKCFCGFDRKTAEAAKLYLLCAAANAAGA